MGLWQPETQSKFSTITLSRGDTPTWTYTLDRKEKRLFPDGGEAVIEFRNTFGQVFDTWLGEIADGKAIFPDVEGDSLVRGLTYTLTLEDEEGRPRQVRWGNLVRNEARWPDHPDSAQEPGVVAYSYSFGTPGFVVDPAWRIINGHPRVYDNSGDDLPNAVAAGSLLGGDWTVFDDVAMQYYAPLKTDAVRLTYQVVKENVGDAWVVICSNYVADNYAAFRHVEVSGSSDYIAIATGSGPVTVTNRATETYTTEDLDTFTAEYNPASNTYSLYLGEDLEPVLSWQDATGIVKHGTAHRYVGFGFKSGLLSPGVEIANWFINDSV